MDGGAAGREPPAVCVSRVASLWGEEGAVGQSRFGAHLSLHGAPVGFALMCRISGGCFGPPMRPRLFRRLHRVPPITSEGGCVAWHEDWEVGARVAHVGMSTTLCGSGYWSEKGSWTEGLRGASRHTFIRFVFTGPSGHIDKPITIAIWVLATGSRAYRERVCRMARGFAFCFAPPCARVVFGVLRVAVLVFFGRWASPLPWPMLCVCDPHGPIARVYSIVAALMPCVGWALR